MTQKISSKFLKFDLFHNEKGSAIIFALLILVTITIIGITSMNASLTEKNIVRNERSYKRNFNIAESGYKKEAYFVGHSSKDWYKVINPGTFNQSLAPDPSKPGDYDPGGDIGTTVSELKKSDTGTWPSGNIFNDTSDNKFDYVYLTTYLNPDKAPKGYDADSFSGYKFRMNSRNSIKNKPVVAIEVGGIKVGVKVSGF